MKTHIAPYIPALTLSKHRLFAMTLALAALIVSARLSVPMLPVPITLQTAIVLMLPVLFGYKAALSVLASYFTLGLMGFPVFALAASGFPYFIGPTAGYLAGFVVAISAIALALKHIKPSMTNLFGLMLIGHAIILLCGTLWLAFGLPFLGLMPAIAAGTTPFIVGSVLKSGIAAGFSRYIIKS